MQKESSPPNPQIADQIQRFLPRFPKEKLAVTTAYDYPFSRLAEAAQVDAILVGDSLANVVLGYDSTKKVGMEVMLLFTGASRRGAPHTHIIGDLPYMSYETPDDALHNSRLLLEAGADSVKLEGYKPEVVQHLVKNQIPVMGHLGLLPQTATSFKSVGHHKDEQSRILDEAIKLSLMGIYALVLENINAELAQQITSSIPVPTIGIGAGKGVGGQVLVLHDLLGLTAPPPFARSFGSLGEAVKAAFAGYISEVRSGTFPASKL